MFKPGSLRRPFFCGGSVLAKRELMLGNEAIARGLLENGCAIATSYPGTPASEILSSLMIQKNVHASSMHTQWAINEKVAFEIAYAGCMTGLRSAVSMKQVGLNVASDPLMSAAYLGTEGGFIVICADDPGPHSSQTEQDSRLMAMMAKIPVLDPDSPKQAKELVETAFKLSETYKIPVMLRPTTRICHSRQDILPGSIQFIPKTPEFHKDPSRWAATPKFRFLLHKELEDKLNALASDERTLPIRLNPGTDGPRVVVASGVAAGHTKEILKSLKLWDSVPFYQVIQPFPLHTGFISDLLDTYKEVLVLEETTGVIEMQLADRHRVKGKHSGIVPKAGELLPEQIEEILCRFSHMPFENYAIPAVPGKRPTLCAGCPHRASFFAIKKAVPKGIYTSDIGCYTLGLNLGAVDTVLCMGAAIGQASGFYHAFKDTEKRPDIVATIGDSTFFHAGMPALVDAVVNDVRFVLVILDNRTTAMTGNQPTPTTCGTSNDEAFDLPGLIKGCGIDFCRTADPYQVEDFMALIKDAVHFSREKGPAVIIARHPCLLDPLSGAHPKPIPVEITDDCDGCGYCIQQFECPALILDETEDCVQIDTMSCTQCGVCISVCPKGSIQKGS
jgi:indolepyruvate ferredoxin oxidoreductase alpha subunit